MHIFENDPISPDQKIWKYLRLERFTELIETRQVHFASANQFIDPFEGAVAVQPYDWPVDPRYAEKEFGEWAFSELKRLTKISCWHIENYESNAMWELYSGRGKGVAITSTPNRVLGNLEAYRIKPEFGAEALVCGSVKYVNLMTERLSVSMHKRFYYKHLAFSWEKEFRFSVSLRHAEESGVQVPESGIFLSAETESLIEEIHIGPDFNEAERQAIIAKCKDHGLDDRISITSMIGKPRYT